MNCVKCDSKNLYTVEKGNQIGLYCSDCGKWQKWLGKDEFRKFIKESKSDIKNFIIFLEIALDLELKDYQKKMIENYLNKEG